jgi:5-methylcytosine-specific restriction protein A
MATTPYRSRLWPPTRLAVLERDHYRCRIRGPGCTSNATDADHIIPWQEGGSWFGMANLRAACAHCNRGRGPRRMAAMAKLNRQPAATPSRDW